MIGETGNPGGGVKLTPIEPAGHARVTYDGMMIAYVHVRNALDLLHQMVFFL